MSRVADLLAAGMTRGQIRAALASGALERIRHGVVAIPQSTAEDEHRHRAAALALRYDGTAVVSHESAAIFHGMPLPRGLPSRVHLSSLGDDHLRDLDHVLSRAHHPRLPVVILDGVPVTSRMRTALDIAQRRRLPQALVTVEWAIRQEAIEHGRAEGDHRDDSEVVEEPRHVAHAREVLEREIAFYACRTGVHWLRELPRIASPLSESPLESRSKGEFLDAGITIIGQQVRLLDAEGVQRRADFMFAPWLIGEADGRIKYEGPEGTEVLMREKERDQALRAMGIETLRWSGPELIEDPQRVIRRLRRLLSTPPLRIWRSNGR